MFKQLTGVSLIALMGCFIFSKTNAAALEDAGAIVTINTPEYTSDTDLTAAGAQNVFQSNGGNLSFLNSANIQTENGAALFLNGQDPFPYATINNSGNITTSGAGYGIYAKVYQGRPVNVNIANSGTIDRIYLSQSHATNIVNEVSGTINGTITLATNAFIENNGMLGNKDTGSLDDNTITMGKNSTINNGIFFGDKNAVNDDEKYDQLFGHGTIQTNNIITGNNSSIRNGFLIDNQSIQMGNDSILTNFMSAYTVTDPSTVTDGTDHNAIRKILTNSIVMGDYATISNEMGGIIAGSGSDNTGLWAISEISLGKNSNVVNGATPSLNLKPPTDGETEEGAEDQEQKLSVLVTDKLTMKDNATIQNNVATFGVAELNMGDNSTLTHYASSGIAQNVTMGKNSTFIINASEKKDSDFLMKLIWPEKAATLTMGDGAAVSMTSVKTTTQNEQGEDTIQTFTTSLGDYTPYASSNPNAMIIVPELQSITLGDDSSFSTVGSLVTAETLNVGNNANFNIDGLLLYETEDAKVVLGSQLLFSESAHFGDNSTLKLASQFQSPKITFGEKAEITTEVFLFFDTLNMGKGSTITVTENFGKLDALTLEGQQQIEFLNRETGEVQEMRGLTYLSTDSKILLNSFSNSQLCSSFGACQGGTIVGGVQRAEGAKNTQIISATDSGYYGLISGGVDVDEIILQQNSLHLSGDVKGKITMNSDTVLSLVGTDAYIHDPIKKADGATNTTIEVALEDTQAGDRNYFTTHNTMQADLLKIKSGGMILTRPVDFGSVVLGNNAILKVTGNFSIGNITEENNEAVNTTFAVDIGTGNQYNSSGSIVLDRVVLESGIYNVNHSIVTVNDGTSQTNEEGIEMGSDAVLNVNTAIDTNQLVRQQDQVSVNNTTVNVNNTTLTVHRNFDIDTLNLNNARLNLLNDNSTAGNTMKLTNDLNVNQGSIVEGNGTLTFGASTFNLNQGGRVIISSDKLANRPISSLTIQGAFNTAAGSVIDLRTQNPVDELDATPVANDKLIIDGTWNVSDGTRLILRDAKAGHTYTFANVDRLNGSIDNITTSFLWDGTQITQNGNDLSLSFQSVKTLSDGMNGTKINQNTQNLIGAMDEINRAAAAAGKMPSFMDSILYAGSAQEAAAYAQKLLPESYLASHRNILQTLSMTNRNISNILSDVRMMSIPVNRGQPTSRLYGGRSGGDFYYRTADGRYIMYSNDSTAHQDNINRQPSTYRTEEGGIWVKPFYTQFTQDDMDSFSGYEFKTYGLNAGIDKRFSETLSLGLNILFGSGDLKQNDDGLDVDITTYGIGLYGNYSIPNTQLFAEFLTSFARQDNDSKRHIAAVGEIATASYNNTTYAGAINLGYDWQLSKYFSLFPKIGVNAAFISIDDIDEKGSSAALKIKSDSMTSIQTPVELTAVMKLPIGQSVQFLPEAHVRWAHEFGDVEAVSTSSFIDYPVAPFKTKGMETDRELFTIGVGGNLSFAESQLYFKYDYDFSSSTSGHTFHLGYAWSF